MHTVWSLWYFNFLFNHQQCNSDSETAKSVWRKRTDIDYNIKLQVAAECRQIFHSRFLQYTLYIKEKDLSWDLGGFEKKAELWTPPNTIYMDFKCI